MKKSVFHLSSLCKQGLSLSLAGLFLITQVVCVHSTETSFWKARQIHLKNNRAISRNTQQLAALPTLPALSGPLNPKTQPIGASIQALYNKEGVSKLLSSIPLQYGRVEESKLIQAKNTSSLPKNQHPSNLNQVVILQDVHQNLEAQKNSAEILQALIREKQVDFVAVEGAFEKLDLVPFRSYPRPEVTRAVADYFLNENRIGAVSYVGVTSPEPIPPFYGVDDKNLYIANVQAYQKSHQARDAWDAVIQTQQARIAQEKKDVFNPDLLEFDNQVNWFEQEKIDIGEFISYLLKQSQDLSLTLSNVHQSVLHDFDQAYQLERNLDFERIEKEREEVVKRLAEKLSPADLSFLIQLGVHYQSGEVPYASYYQELERLLNKHNLIAEGSPFKSYIRYVLLSDKINGSLLFEALAHAQKETYEKLIQTEAQRRLVNQDRSLKLTGRLVRFELTPQEWSDYQSVRSFFPIPDQPDRIPLSSFEAFYQNAEARSVAMVNNLIATASGPSLQKHQTAVLVTGGFHGPEISHRLNAKGISTIRVSPQITHIDNESGTSYLSVFSREHSPLEKLFEPEQLTVLFFRSILGSPHGWNTWFLTVRKKVNQEFSLLSEKLTKIDLKKIKKIESELEQSDFFHSIKHFFTKTIPSWVNKLDKGFIALDNIRATWVQALARNWMLTGALLIPFLILGMVWHPMWFAGVLVVPMLVAAGNFSQENDNRSWLQRNFPILDGRPIVEVTAEMALSLDQLNEMKKKQRDFLLDRNNPERERGALARIVGFTRRLVAMAQSIGGIGPLLSDRFIALADLGASPVVITPLYDQVYSQQGGPGELAMQRFPSAVHLKDTILKDAPQIEVTLPTLDGRGEITLIAWELRYKKGRIYLLENPSLFEVPYPGWTDGAKQWPDENQDQGIKNKDSDFIWALGRGALKLCMDLKIKPGIINQSEWMSALANPRIRNPFKIRGEGTYEADRFETELQNYFADSLVAFNDHTPVLYAHPHWTLAVVRALGIDPIYYRYFPAWVRDKYQPVWFEHGAEDSAVANLTLDITKVLVAASDLTYGVSKAHADVMKKIPILRDVINSIHWITNGVLVGRWQAKNLENINDLTNDELLARKNKYRRKALRFLSLKLKKGSQWLERVKDLHIIRFERRPTPYKRLDLIVEMLFTPSELIKFLNSNQILPLAGRNHQDDGWARTLLTFLLHVAENPQGRIDVERMIEVLQTKKPNSDEPEVKGIGGKPVWDQLDTIRAGLTYLNENPETYQKVRDRILFLRDYNIYEAPILVQGSEGSIMLADDGEEASATGFQKDQLNLAIVIAVPGQGAIDESTLFYNHQAFQKALDNEDYQQTVEYKESLGNGFAVPLKGKNVHLQREMAGPTLEGLVQALVHSGNVFKGLSPDGTIRDSHAHPTMMRNANAQKDFVSVKRVGEDMIRKFGDLLQRQHDDQEAFNRSRVMGKQFASENKGLSGDIRNRIMHGLPFRWQYQYREGQTANPRTIYFPEGREEHGTVKDMINGFKVMKRMGSFGRRGLLYHIGEEKKNHFQDHFINLINSSNNELLITKINGSSFLTEWNYRVSGLKTKKITVEDRLREARAEMEESSAFGIQERNQEIIKEEEKNITRINDDLIREVYVFMGFLEGMISEDESQGIGGSKATPGALALWKWLGLTDDVGVMGRAETRMAGISVVFGVGLLKWLGRTPAGPPSSWLEFLLSFHELSFLEQFLILSVIVLLSFLVVHLIGSVDSKGEIRSIARDGFFPHLVTSLNATLTAAVTLLALPFILLAFSLSYIWVGIAVALVGIEIASRWHGALNESISQNENLSPLMVSRVRRFRRFIAELEGAIRAGVPQAQILERVDRAMGTPNLGLATFGRQRSLAKSTKRELAQRYWFHQSRSAPSKGRASEVPRQALLEPGSNLIFYAPKGDTTKNIVQDAQQFLNQNRGAEGTSVQVVFLVTANTRQAKTALQKLSASGVYEMARMTHAQKIRDMITQAVGEGANPQAKHFILSSGLDVPQAFAVAIEQLQETDPTVRAYVLFRSLLESTLIRVQGGYLSEMIEFSTVALLHA